MKTTSPSKLLGFFENNILGLLANDIPLDSVRLGILSQGLMPCLRDETLFERAAWWILGLTPGLLEKASKHRCPYVRGLAVRHPNVTADILDRLITQDKNFIRCMVAEHPNATPAILEKAAIDISDSVRREAVSHPNASVETLRKALNDKSPWVRRAAEKSLREREVSALRNTPNT